MAEDSVGPDFYSTEQLNALESKAESFDKPIQAALAGAARGATFGLSDVVASAVSPSLKEYLANLRQYNPSSSFGGEVAGVVAPSLLSGGAGLLGEGAAAVAAPVRGVSAAGKFAENMALRSLGEETAKNVLAKAAAKGLGSAVEGAFYGAGQVVSEGALGDPKIAAEHALGTIGLSALLSGGLTAGLNVAGSAIKKAASEAKRYTPQIRQALTGVSKDTEELITQPERFAQIQSIGDKGATPDEAIFAHMNEVAEKNNQLRYDTIDRVKSNVDDILKTRKLQNTTRSAESLINEIDSRLSKISPSGNFATSEIEGSYNDLVRIKERLKNYVAETAGVLPEDLAALPTEEWKLTGSQLNELKTQYQKSVGTWTSQIGKSDEVLKTYKSLSGISNDLLSSINPKIKEQNAILSRAIKAQEELKNYGLAQEGMFNPQKMQGMIGQTKNWELIKKNLGIIDENLGTTLLDDVSNARAFKEVYPKDVVSAFQTGRSNLPGAIGAGVGGLMGGVPGAAAGALTGFALASPAMRLARVNAVRAAEDVLSGNIAQKLAKLGGQGGRVIPDNLIPFVSSQVSALANIERGQKRIQNVIDSEAKNLFDSSSPKYSADSLKTLNETNFGKNYVKASPDRLKAFQERSKEINSILSDPEKLSNLIANNTSELKLIAPQITAALISKAVEAASVLGQSIPKPKLSDPLRPDNTAFEPSDHELARFERIVQTIENPVSILKDLKSGTITSDQIQVLKNLYPTIYQNMAMAIQMQAMQQDSIPYATRLKISTFLGHPTTPALNSSTLQLLQSPIMKMGGKPTRLGGGQTRQSRQTQVERIMGR